ncbi:hypothetical protein IHE32_12565 (plasmid) [Mycetohabitans rhizoxinica]
MTERQLPPTIALRANAAGRANATDRFVPNTVYMYGTTLHWNGVRRVAGDTSEEGGLLQTILLLLVLIVPASATYADSRYVEVWNPPEARLVHPSKSSHKPTTGHKHAAKQPPTRIAKVAEPALGGTATASVTPPPAPRAAAHASRTARC